MHQYAPKVAHALSRSLQSVVQDASTGGGKRPFQLVAISPEGGIPALAAPVTRDIAALKREVDALGTLGGTDIVEALALSLASLPAAAPGERQFVILMTDGIHNEGPEDYAASLEDARRRGVCVYSIGFGADVREESLRRIAAGSGCGKYAPASAGASGFDLIAQYLRVRHSTTGTVLLEQTGMVRHGQTVTLPGTSVLPGVGELAATLAWPGSRAELMLTDPSGRRVDAGYPGATITQDAALVTLFILRPAPGLWTAEVRGLEVPEETMPFYAALSARAGPPALSPQEAADEKEFVNASALAVVGGILAVAVALVALAVVIGIQSTRRRT